MSKKLIVSDIKLGVLEPYENIFDHLLKNGLEVSDSNIKIIRQSIDARDKNDIKYIYSLEINGDYKLKSRHSNKISFNEIKKYKLPKCGEKKAINRHVIVGTGPAGLFAGLILARCGMKPLIIERGEDVDRRKESVKNFWDNSKLNTESNVCFGEGGAGTYSDGKLNTGVKDSLGRKKFILDTFIKAGADESVGYWYKPHIGSDVLSKIVKYIREEIISLGGEVRFNTRLDKIEINDGVKLIVSTRNVSSDIQAETVILATGHSAKDIYYMLDELGAHEESKPFAVGVRIEHPQEMINASQYGDKYTSALPAADYKCTYNAANTRGVYSFCMCPGGQVVNSSNEEGGTLVNGMSNFSREGRNANSAIVVTVNKNDYGDDLFGGLNFQRTLERHAFHVGDGKVPVQTLGDFNNNKTTCSFGCVEPDICGEYCFGNLRNIFPEEINDTISEGINNFGKKIQGFDREDAVLSGVESRTSSPIRIYRDENFESNIKGLFPCGEGAGYAGGIMSAAIDGIKVAEEIVRRYKPS